jgi:ribosomal protein S18 acetylase RimI-like enzyme
VYRLLTTEDFHPLYECFLEAFSDYQVNMQMSEEQFQQRVVRDRVDLESSVGAFDDDRMIGFYMNGRGAWEGEQTAYDAGTGVVPDYRRRGVARELFDFMVPRLKERGITQYLLEVLTSNERAVALYRKIGFEEVRRLAVLRSKQMVKTSGEVEGLSIRRLEKPDWDVFCAYWDGKPSWQSSIDAVESVRDQREIVGALVDGQCVGYGVVYWPDRLLMQLAVAPAFRRRGIGRRILATLSGDGILKVNNVDEELKGTLAFFKANGFEIVLGQFEMMRTL